MLGQTTSATARPKGGGGFVLNAGGPTYNPNTDYTTQSFFGIGGQGISYAGPFFRTGLELGALLTSTGASIRGGALGDFVFGHIANADIYAGAGLGLGGGPIFFNGASLYVRPEVGIQWNLGRTAIDAKLFSLFAVPMATNKTPNQTLILPMSPPFMLLSTGPFCLFPV